MSANLRGLSEPCNRIASLICVFVFTMSGAAFALPPYNVTVTFSPPTSGGAPDGYNFYVDDCAITGPAGIPVSPSFDPLIADSGVVSGRKYVGLITADGTYKFCVRAVNATGEQPDPGQVTTQEISDLPLPGPVENLDVQTTCPNGGCTIIITVN